MAAFIGTIRFVTVLKMATKEMSDITALTTPATLKLFASVVEGLGKSIKAPARKALDQTLAALQGYSKYLEETHNRVSTFKTFADPTKPVNLLDHFVSTKLLQSKKKEIDQNEIIRLATGRAKIVVSASAGFGKSMLMRYISLCLFENPSGKIPIFIELKNLNRISNPDILEYIHSTYKQSSDVQRIAFSNALEDGVFSFIFDGFDELNHDIRGIVEDQILAISGNFPKNSMIVSGRPDERFSSWRIFRTFKICPMSKKQVIELINKLDYDKGTKKRFIEKIRSGEFDRHQSFLSTPLLSVLMLMTFEQNANIPEKMHLFYNTAFETLFHKHDALKEQYERKRKSKLNIQDFAAVFSIFCVNTYVLEKTEFTKTELLDFITKALSYYNIESSTEDFIFDIQEAICLIQQEGPSYFFVHRSFQEYFTSLFMSKCPEKLRDEFIDRVYFRYWYNVLSMLYDMAADQLEASWIKRRCDEYLTKVGYSGGQIDPVVARFPNFMFFQDGNRWHLWGFGSSEFTKFIIVMSRFYPRQLKLGEGLDLEILGEKMKSIPGIDKQIKDAKTEESTLSNQGKTKILNISNSDELRDWVVETGVYESAKKEYESIKKIRDSILSEIHSREKFISNLFAKTDRSLS